MTAIQLLVANKKTLWTQFVSLSRPHSLMAVSRTAMESLSSTYYYNYLKEWFKQYYFILIKDDDLVENYYSQ